MENNLINLLSEEYLQTEYDMVQCALTRHLGKAPGKVEEFLIKKIQRTDDNPNYSLYFDDALLGQMEFGMEVDNEFITFTSEGSRDTDLCFVKNTKSPQSEYQSLEPIKRSLSDWPI